MNALLLDILPQVRQGYCCSQLLFTLAQQLVGADDSDLMPALRGLCRGIGQSGGPCGLLTGGAAVLAWLSSPKADEPHPMLDAMTNEYATWFMEKVQAYGGTGCESIAAGLAAAAGSPLPEGGMPPMELWGDLLAQCWEKILELYDAYELDGVRN